MAKFLQQLLGNNEPLFSTSLHGLEMSTSHSGTDLELIADITHAAHEIMRTLSLDPADSTAREVYLVLNAQVGSHDFELLFVADFVLLNINDELVSFNIIDVIENAHHQLPFEQRIVTHGQRALRGEIIQRYLAHDLTDEASTNELASQAGLLVPGDESHVKASDMRQQSENRDTQPYILAIGDIFSDAFIKLNEQQARIDTDDDGTKRLSVEFGAKLPYDQVDVVNAVGPSPNAAV